MGVHSSVMVPWKLGCLRMALNWAPSSWTMLLSALTAGRSPGSMLCRNGMSSMSRASSCLRLFPVGSNTLGWRPLLRIRIRSSRIFSSPGSAPSAIQGIFAIFPRCVGGSFAGATWRPADPSERLGLFSPLLWWSPASWWSPAYCRLRGLVARG